jgi:hypothetical protein
MQQARGLQVAGKAPSIAILREAKNLSGRKPDQERFFSQNLRSE